MRSTFFALCLLALSWSSVKQGDSCPPEFGLAAAEAAAAWTRAQIRVAEKGEELGITPVLTPTETELKTAPPTEQAGIYAFVAWQRQRDGSWRFKMLAGNANLF